MSVKISSLNTASTIDSGAAIHIAGNNPLTFSDWGGGWFMQDGTWVRSYNNKSLWMGAGYIGGDGGLTIGYGGTATSAGGAIIAGSVGIGTSTPQNKLHVIGNAWINRPSNKIDNNGSPTEFGSRVEFNNDFATSASGYMVFRYPTSNNFLIGGDYDGHIGGAIPNIQFGRSNGTVYLHIDASTSGNIGIGTTSPIFTLDVLGLSRTKRSGVNGAGLAGVIVLATDAKTIGDGQSLAFQGHNSSNADTTYGNIYTTIVSPTASAHSSSMTFKVYNSASGVDALTLANTGAATFASSVTTGGDIIVNNSSNPYSSTNRGAIFLNGVANSLYGFGVGGVAKGYLYHEGTNMYFENSVSGGFFNIVQVGAGYICFQTNGSEKMRLNSSGNLLIGTATDSGYKLYVNGTGLFNGVVNSYATMDNLARRFISPEGASYVTSTSSVTGAIKIKLPVARNNSSTMMMFRVKIYQYSTGNSFELQIGGYNYGLGNWYNVFATNLTDDGSNLSVRFGTDATSDCVWIGELGSTWSYPQVFVTDFQAGYSGQDIAWATGWGISFETAFDTVELSRLASQVITSRNIASQSVSYATTAGALTSMLISQFTNDAGYITSGVSGSGTTDYLPKWTGASDLGDSLLQEGTSSIGLGVTPSAWDASFKALQIGVGTALYNNSSANGTFLGSNFFYNGSDNEYISTGTATGYGQVNGTHNWYTAISGSAGTLVSFTNVMKLDASGQLGIGTTTPVTALDVVGGAYTNTTAKFGNTKPIYIINQDPHIGFNTYYDSGWKYGAGSSGSFSGTLGCASSTGDFTLQTSTAGGNAGNTATLVALMTWKQNGYVGIGTASPGAKLEIEAATAGYASIIRNTTAGGDYLKMIGDSGNTVFEFGSGGTGGDGFLNIYSDNSQKVLINADGISYFNGGNVGIGTTSPLNLLHVSQPSANTIFRLGNNASYDQFIYFNGGNDWSLGMDYSNSNAFVLSNASSIGTNDRLVVTTGGNVGIGTTAPEFLLDIAGGNARINGVMVGKGSNSVSTNLAVGVNPLYSNTSGSENTAIGYFAMYSTTTAIRNTALGNNALYSNTTGNSNVAVGVGSLYSNDGGLYNSSVGYHSMQYMRGHFNSALGRDSMRGSLTAANNTGEYNTAVGYESMLLLTSGNWNTAVGNQAGTNLSTGSYNTFIGRSTVAAAGGLVTTGSNNTIIGGYAGTTTLASTVVLADGAGQVQLWATGKNVALGTITPTTYANYTTLHIAGQTTTNGGVLRLTTSDSSIAVNIFTNNAGANYDTTTSHSHLFNINGASSLIVSSSGIETAGSITTADPGLGAAAWQLGDVQTATVSLITSQYVEVVIGGSSYQLALVQLE